MEGEVSEGGSSYIHPFVCDRFFFSLRGALFPPPQLVEAEDRPHVASDLP